MNKGKTKFRDQGHTHTLEKNDNNTCTVGKKQTLTNKRLHFILRTWVSYQIASSDADEISTFGNGSFSTV